MEHDLSIANLVWQASWLVKCVMLVLLAASVASWTLIFGKRRAILSARRAAEEFEDRFWASEDLAVLYQRITAGRARPEGMEKIFEAGFKEYARLRKRDGVAAMDIVEGAQRAMRVAQGREMEGLEANLPTLATIGSVSPYVGLFGTVWGIMNSFQALGNQHQATLAMVAPGISEALVATAMGLFAAIPAVVAYNRYTSDVDRLYNRYELFMEEFSSILQRQAHH
ncbi:MAG TPA: protein TolQ [Gammaproteobacteria bacterium]|nr:protein TolQ [Gammaproteobacteria bacterium]